MAWVYLVVGGVLEVVWVFFMKESRGFTKPTPTLLTLVTMAASFALLSVSMRTLPLGTAYAVWTGIGAVGAFVVGVLAFNESASLLRVTAVAMIVGGLVLMKVASHAPLE
ncbi:DMT family transporter [Botrimarina mediterranea]|uniref:Guanidinium exporter n=1 Tax=Botrimarina mediterranea TaxID=2528022 RepID=A0A518K9B6_9BACT|nr:multidrug efflux SMR transporter [Botrimarina mediterranea]QDV74377.1 Quaternary ammonium compound-resistance protein SugE [Botrimarina mediterranea]QDV78973.1 Quaternary ammonium compound-resistance protein SugE [Planctomycetes bacterium K2D]